MGTKIFRKIDTWLLLWFIGYIGNVLAVSHTPCSSVFLYTCCYVLLYVLLRCLPIERINPRFFAFFCASLGLWQALLGIGQLLGLFSSGHKYYALTGSFSNPGPYGAFLALMLIVVISEYRKNKNFIFSIAIFAMAVVLPVTWSRAAILAFAVSFAFMYRTWVVHHLKEMSICAITVILVMYIVKPLSANSRFFMMIISFNSFIDNLWLGTGVGAYLHTLGEGMATYFKIYPESVFISSVGVADHSFNYLVKIAVEQGLFGVIPLTVAIILSARSLFQASSYLFYPLILLLVFSMFSYPFSLPVFCLMLIFIMAYAANITRSWRFRTILVFLLIFLVVVGGNSEKCNCSAY